MNIAVIAHNHHPIAQPFAGGVEAHTQQLVAELLRVGHIVTLYAKAGSQTDARVIEIFSGDAQGGRNPACDTAYDYAMDDIEASSYDLVINNSLHYTPLIKHHAGMPPMLTIFHTPPLPKMSAALRQQPIVANRSYAAVSACTAKQWQSYCADRIQVIANGIDISIWEPELQPPDQPTAAWAGRIVPEKGLHVAIEACLQMGIPLTFAGNICDQNYFDKRIAPYVDDESIRYIGHADHLAVNALFASASVVLVTPLWEEPFGLTAVEAWASGSPVAALPNGALPSLVNSKVGVLAASDDASDLAIAVRYALRLGRNDCRVYAETEFSLAKMAALYVAAAVYIKGRTLDYAYEYLTVRG